jgi:hypothetical protein
MLSQLGVQPIVVVVVLVVVVVVVGVTQLPWSQTSPAAQAVPHVPQLFESVCVSVQLGSQPVNPLGQQVTCPLGQQATHA